MLKHIWRWLGLVYHFTKRQSTGNFISIFSKRLVAEVKVWLWQRSCLQYQGTVGIHEPVVSRVQVNTEPTLVIIFLSVPQINDEAVTGRSGGHLKALVSLHWVVSFSLLSVLESVNSSVLQVETEQRSEGKEEWSHCTANSVAMTLIRISNVTMTQWHQCNPVVD